MSSTKKQINTIGVGGILIGIITSYYSPHSLTNIPFLVGIVSIFVGIAVLLGK